MKISYTDFDGTGRYRSLVNIHFQLVISFFSDTVEIG